MTDTDAGKRLNDAEPISQEEIREWFGDEIPMEVVTFMFAPENANKTVGEMRAWTRKYVQTHPRLTANRGSVSEERAGDIPARIVKLCESRPAFDWSNYREGLDLDDAIEFLKDDFVALDEAADALAAIQQAVSECSGDGAEGVVVPKAFTGRVAIVKSWDGWPYHLECVAGRFTTEDGYQRFPDPELVLPESLLKSNCNECRKPMLAALPLPPSPVKEIFYGYFENAQDEMPAYDPPHDAPCPFCGKAIHAKDVRTHSLMYAGNAYAKRSYFYRTHRTCAETDPTHTAMDAFILDMIARNGD